MLLILLSGASGARRRALPATISGIKEAFTVSSADQEDTRRAKNHTMALIQEHDWSSSEEEEVQVAGSPREEAERILAMSETDHDYHYKVLKLRRIAATEEEVIKSFRFLALAVHPDKSVAAGLAKEEADKLFKIVSAAKDKVLQEVRRAPGTWAIPSRGGSFGRDPRGGSTPPSGGARQDEPSDFGRDRWGSRTPPSGGAGQGEPSGFGRGQWGSFGRDPRGGDIIELTGLDKKPDLNGKHGTVISQSGERWTVELRSGKQVAIKRENLLLPSRTATPEQMEEAQLFLRSLQGEYAAKEGRTGQVMSWVVVDGEGKCTYTPTDGDPQQYVDQLIVADDGEITMSKMGWKTQWRLAAARERRLNHRPRRFDWRRRGDLRMPVWVGLTTDEQTERDKRAWQAPPPRPDTSVWGPGRRVEVVGHSGLFNMKQGTLGQRLRGGVWVVTMDESVGGKFTRRIHESHLKSA